MKRIAKNWRYNGAAFSKQDRQAFKSARPLDFEQAFLMGMHWAKFKYGISPPNLGSSKVYLIGVVDSEGNVLGILAGPFYTYREAHTEIGTQGSAIIRHTNIGSGSAQVVVAVWDTSKWVKVS